MPEEVTGHAPIFHGAFLSCFFVAALYLWAPAENRNLSTTIKRRFISVAIASVISIFYVFWCSSAESFAELLIDIGFRTDHVLVAATVPVLLTACLFLGPLLLLWYEGSFVRLLDVDYWRSSFSDVLWWRNHVVAPFSEEFVYRACLVEVLARKFRCYQLVVISPLFFGIAHVHHIVDNVRQGMLLKKAVLIAIFQFCYTTMFGAYSAYLFIRTGHFVSPFLAHAFCNAMGFPDFTAILYGEGAKAHTMRLGLFVGLFLWLLFLVPLTNPRLYGGSQYWREC